MINNQDLAQENISIDIKLLLEAIYLKYGHDFRNYSQAHLKRRILHRLMLSNINSISEMQYKVLHEPEFMQEILTDFSINVTEMFRDPAFYLTMRKDVLPVLRTYPYIKIWHAGCSTGEEVYSMAILLEEEGLLDKTLIYATDNNETVLKVAKKAEYSTENLKNYQKNYEKGGGKGKLSDYYEEKGSVIKFDPRFRKRIVFSEHNLVTDNVFTEVHLIICRNVLIYFNRNLQNRVIKLFHDSLMKEGVLGIGSKESVDYSRYGDAFEYINKNQKIYIKKSGNDE
ncbi:MAG: protein-glutamate O-methyltransferase CheR [Bacteroidales bacterium]|nr:protein-glutamate O-methyltransferase CheR [Bacteroidales bacterium]MCF8336760.1 protein-glutamate O-methyltransferase CheR [Bacteroidales bacterium]